MRTYTLTRHEIRETRLESRDTERKFLAKLAVEHDCLLSKDGSILIRSPSSVELPELFTLTEGEYEAMHAV